MNNPLVIAQISDCHLFAEPSSLHYGANVYQNLIVVLSDIKKNSSITTIVFTGDLTQDHSVKSYQLFVQAIAYCQISIPVCFLSGNHDEPELLTKYLVGDPYCPLRVIENDHWQALLVESKSKVIEGPAGQIDDIELEQLHQRINAKKHQILFMHHHPVDVGYFIDKHGLNNRDEFWQTLDNYSSIVGIACGHVHRGATMTSACTNRSIDVYTCPATSIQFDPLASTVKALEQGPGYRLFTLYDHGELKTSLHYPVDHLSL
ncbi:MAG: metallophosphoesterase [Colwellia sp.]|nr:metallophosphoesterase [Colwellia sp.]